MHDSNGSPVDDFRLKLTAKSRPHMDQVWAQFNDGRKFVHARIRNDGDVPLYGVQTGLQWGFAAVVHKVFSEEGEVLYENGTVFVLGVIQPGETGDAMGTMEIRRYKGRYLVEGRVAINGLGYCGTAAPLGVVEAD